MLRANFANKLTVYLTLLDYCNRRIKLINMNKQQIIKNLQLAQPDHMAWIRQAQKLIKGLPESDIKKPVACTDCHFGQWYKREGSKLVTLSEFKELEAVHKTFHGLYTALYYMTFDRRKKARSTIITGGLEIPVEEKAFRLKKLKQLEKKGVEMVLLMKKIEKSVAQLTTKHFESIWFQ